MRLNPMAFTSSTFPAHEGTDVFIASPSLLGGRPMEGARLVVAYSPFTNGAICSCKACLGIAPTISLATLPSTNTFKVGMDRTPNR